MPVLLIDEIDKADADVPNALLGVLGRADLLRALAVTDRDQLALDDEASSWFGYVRQDEPSPEPQTVTITNRLLSEPKPEPPAISDRRLPLRMPFLHTIVRRETRPPPDPASTGQNVVGPAEPLDEKNATAISSVRLVSYEDLVPQVRLLPALRRMLGATGVGSLDVDRLTDQIAANEMPRRLPRRRVSRWHPELVVILDICARSLPYHEDMHRLAERLLRHCGRSGVSLRVINDGPFGEWTDWQMEQNRQHGTAPKRRWTMPPAGTPVLLASDLGLLLGTASAESKAWTRFIESLVRAQLRPIVLAPLGACQIDATLATLLPILRWSPDARMRPAHVHGVSSVTPNGLDDLLAMMAATRRIDPPLLRAMRRLNPQAPLDAGLEGAAWCHPDFSQNVFSIRAEARERHLRRFTERLPHLHAVLDALRSRHHAHLRAVLNHEESLLWEAHADRAVVATSPEALDRIKAARAFMQSLLATLTPLDRSAKAAVWWGVAQEIVERADGIMGERHADLLNPMLAALHRRIGQEAHLPAWADPAAIAAHVGNAPQVQCWLVRDAARASVLLQAEPAGERQQPLGEALVVDAEIVHARWGEGARAVTRWLSASKQPIVLCPLSELGAVQIDTARESITVGAVLRPRGAQAWGTDSNIMWGADSNRTWSDDEKPMWRDGGNGIVVRSAPLATHTAGWSGDELRFVPWRPAPDAPHVWRVEAAVEKKADGTAGLRFGIDAPHGPYADLTVTTRHGTAIQRLRWIEPGTFLMGSPEDELERSRDEGSQHPVTLTKGFWLADTACTQALWQTVMGSNPSHFMVDNQRPVESVSWEDIQGFLRNLERLMPESEAKLTTEAQWEYACRAGTVTPFSFGEQITPEQVNYDGNHPYAGGKKGKFREATVAVKSLPPNDWGLYQMHGNVWEWCADGQRRYDGKPQQDPEGQALTGKEAHRAIRGGSWIDAARGARSAYRDADRPGDSDRILGFRFSLRSIEPGSSLVLPGGQDEVAPGGRRGR